MKALLHILVCCLIFVQLHAQTSKIKNEWTTFKAANQKSAVNLMQDKATLKLAQDDRLTLFSTQDDALGYRHTRYQQTYKNVPIEGAIYLMHEKNNRVQIANGKLVRDLNISVTPSIPEATALQSALQHINATLYAWDDPTHENLKKQIEACEDATFYPAGELVIIDPKFGEKAEQYRLAYKFDIYAVEPLTRSVVYVDAHNGDVLTTVEKIHNCLDDPATDTSTASGTTNYSEDVYFTACGDNGEYTLANSSPMQVFDAANTNGYPQIPFTSNQAFFDEDPTANEVHWATQKTYEYFLNVHNRNSLDSSGMALYSWIHYGTDYNNAFWNGSWMTYGDGDSILFTSLTSPDVVAHEIVHGLTDFTADLNYSYESGALNESFSDIFGEVAERYMRGSNDWLMGADFTVLAGKNCIRDMSNPNSVTALTQQPDTYLGNYWYDGSGDNGGVHYNSGVQNYWFYLLSEGGLGTNDNWYTYHVNGIGMDKAANIAYRNLTVYLSETSQYTDARAGAIQAAIDLYGAGSNEAIQTEEAWCAVGLCSFNAPCRMSDSLALVALYNATDGANWTNTWDLNQPMDTWYGVALNGNGCVTCIDLDGGNNPCTHFDGHDGNNLSGNLPAEIGDLNSLNFLDLGFNNLSGTIPTELGNLTGLTFLDLGANEFSGSIPVEIGNLINLTQLNLFGNELSGTIPNEIGNLFTLEELNLSYNELNGTIPTGFVNLVQLTELTLRENQLNGSIPVELGSLTNLVILDLGDNQFSGNIPIELGNLISLTYLSIYGSQLSGNIPIELGNLSNLKSLHLSRNQLTGTIPTELGNLIQLEDLNLLNNLLTGAIPVELGNLINLENLWLSENQLSGNIPSEFENLINLGSLSLSENQLSGNIPSELGNLQNLYSLSLRYNQLSGNIPSELGNNLSSLSVSYNQLTGCYDVNLINILGGTNLTVSDGNSFDAPWEDFRNNGIGACEPNPYPTCRQNDSLSLVAFYNATDGANWIDPWDLNHPMNTWNGVAINGFGCVMHLNLYDRQINGTIPPEIGDLYHLRNLDLFDNQLSGNIPAELGNLYNLNYLRLGRNQLSGSIPAELENLSNLKSLTLNSNELSGSIPTELGNLQNLQTLWLSFNELTGNISASLGNLNKLESLSLRSNQFSGCYYVNLMNLCSIGSNSTISDNNNFDVPWEDFCSTGAGECSYGACRYSDSLALVTLYNATDGANWTNTWDLNQPMDSWFGVTLNEDGCVKGLGLSNNQLSGTIPSEIGNLNNLSWLFLNNNQLTGSIPPEIGNLWLWGLSLSNNQLSGCFDIHLQQLCDRVDVDNSGGNIMGGNNFNATWEEFCTNGDAACPNTTTPVWPGDFNSDGIVNNLDLLQWGLAEGITGIPRSNASTDWLSQYCPDWSANIDSINVKHADGDGNGIVDIDDIQALIDNYGNTHTVTPHSPSGSPLRFRLEVISESVNNGVINVTYELYVESTLGGSVSAHGVACSIDFGSLLIDNITVDFANSTLQPDEHINIFDATQNRLDIALTRTDQNNQFCDGAIAMINVSSLDIQSGNPVEFLFNNGKIMAANGTLTDVLSPTYFGVLPEPCSGCSCNRMPANLTAIAGEFSQFANEEFIKNFLAAEKTYIKYQAEINRILESKDARYAKVNEDFDKIKDMAMAMLFQSFVSKRPVTVTDEHIKVIDNFLVSLNQATSKGKLRNEITKVRQHLHVMESKEVKDALIAFDRAGTGTSEVTHKDTPDEDKFEVQLLNTAGRESRVTYNLNKRGTVNISLYNTHGQQIMTLQGDGNIGYHQVPINKNDLPSGIYFIHIEHISDNGIPINKILKLPVIQ